MKAITFSVLALVFAVCAGARSHAQDIGKKEQALTGSQWLPASGVACAKVCEQSGEVAVYSGTYKNGNPFFICRANAPGRLLLTGPRKKRGTMARPKRPRVAYRVAWLPLARSGTRR